MSRGSKQKKIASITSGMGSMGGHASTGAYAYRSSKAALNMVMVTAANELRSRGISGRGDLAGLGEDRYGRLRARRWTSRRAPPASAR